MIKYFKLVFFVFLMVFAGCSNSQTSSGQAEIVTSGKGLEVDFDIDDEYISVGKLNYDITFENSGKDPVILKKENVKLAYSPDDNILTRESINLFYDKIFDGKNEIRLFNGQEFSTSGLLIIDEDFLRNSILSDFNIKLSIDYDYQTEFSKNVLIDTTFSKETDLLDYDGSISQAAPVIIDKIEMNPEIEQNKYELLYYFDDNGDSSDLRDVNIKIKDIELNLGTKELSCSPRLKDSDVFKDLDSYIISSDAEGDLIARCMASLNPDDRYNTLTSGSFKYNYRMEFDEEIDMPEK